MWSLFPELLVPFLVAFAVGSALGWVVITLVLPRQPRQTRDLSRAGDA